MRPRLPLLALGSLTVSCASSLTSQVDEPFGASPYEPSMPSQRISGMLGIHEITSVDVGVDQSVGDDASADDLSVPWIGAQWQVPLRQERLEWGYEAGFSVGWESDRDAVVIDTGTVLVHADNDLRIADLSVGLYAGAPLGERMRIYGGVGPLLQFGWIELELDEDIDGDGSLSENGIGTGIYARVGFEIQTSPSSSVGLVARWVESNIDLGGTLDELDLEGVQIGIVATTGF